MHACNCLKPNGWWCSRVRLGHGLSWLLLWHAHLTFIKPLATAIGSRHISSSLQFCHLTLLQSHLVLQHCINMKGSQHTVNTYALHKVQQIPDACWSQNNVCRLMDIAAAKLLCFDSWLCTIANSQLSTLELPCRPCSCGKHAVSLLAVVLANLNLEAWYVACTNVDLWAEHAQVPASRADLSKYLLNFHTRNVRAWTWWKLGLTSQAQVAGRTHG